jgi:hypothetical protein
MFPAVVRYDECERGMVEHALRLVVAKTRKAYIYPATHFASSTSAALTQYPAMGQRLRLKSDFVIPTTYTKQEKAVLLALKKYGAIVADNGGFFSVSVCPDDRFPANAFNNLSNIDINNFEVVQTTGATGGPRSPGAPSVNAGADIAAQLPATVALSGVVNDPSGHAVVQWKQYSGPGTVAFGDATQPQTSATFSAPGTYTLMLSATDGVHATAYDAVTVSSLPPLALTRSGNDMVVAFATTAGQRYRVEWTSTLGGDAWSTLRDNIDGTGGEISLRDPGATLGPARFYRLTALP